MFKSHFLLGNSVEKSYFRKYSNKLTKIISLAKKLYFADSFKKTKNNPKKTLEILQSFLPTKINNSSFEILIDSKTKSDDPLTIPNCFKSLLFLNCQNN